MSSFALLQKLVLLSRLSLPRKQSFVKKTDVGLICHAGKNCHLLVLLIYINLMASSFLQLYAPSCIVRLVRQTPSRASELLIFSSNSPIRMLGQRENPNLHLNLIY